MVKGMLVLVWGENRGDGGQICCWPWRCHLDGRLGTSKVSIAPRWSFTRILVTTKWGLR